MSPKGEKWEKALEYWKSLKTDADASFDKEINLNANEILPMITWGTSPQDVITIDGKIPNPNAEKDEDKKNSLERALKYMKGGYGSLVGMDVGTREAGAKFIDNLKVVYEDFWKSQNQINTSVKLSLNISIDNSNNIEINKFEKILSDMDLIYNFSIYKFDNRNNFYKVIFNGTPDKFLEVMSNQNYDFEIKNKIWVLNDKS